MKFEFLIAGAVLAALPQLAFAQGEDGDIVIAHPYRPSNIVVVGTRSEQAREKSGQAITLLREVDLERLQLPAVADILAITPGVTVTRNGGIGGFSAVRIRGAEGEQTLVVIDGVRLNDPSSPGGGFDFGSLLVGNIERIEILRGPNSVPWGSQALGGVVSVTTTPAPYNWGGAVRAEYGYKDKLSLVGNAGGRVGPVSASFGGGYFRDDGISSFKGGTERDGFRQYAANGNVSAALNPDIDVDLRGYFADSRTEIDGFPPPFFGFADTTEFSTARQFTGYAGARIRLFDDTLKNRIAFTLSDIDRDNFDVPGQAVPSFLARGRTERFEYQGDATITDAVRAIFGAEHERSRFSDGFARFGANITSGYAQFVIDPADTLTITGGGRIDDHSAYGTKATYSANLAWRPADGTIVRAAFGKGFKAPTLFQLFSFFGNTTLEPETAKSYEVGIEQALLEGALKFGATVFRRDTRNQIDFISCFGQTTGICTNRPFGTYDNVDRARATGLEAFIRAAPSDTLIVEAKYSLIDSKDRVSGLALLRRPKHSLNASIDWDARDWLKLGASLQSISDSADVDFQTFARTRLDGYTLVTLRAVVPISGAIEFYGRVENLFDVRYETVSGYGTYGRNAHVGVRARF